MTVFQTIEDMLVSVTVLLLAIMNIHNNRRIDNLEKWIDLLMDKERREP